MKAFKFIQVLILLGGILLSACAGAPSSPAAPDTTSTGSDKALLSEAVFTGVIESMDSDQWTISGQTVKVAPSLLQDRSFVVGDTVKVEALVAEDGSVTAQRVESPSAADLAGAPQAASTQTPVVFDDSGSEALGTVEAITDTSITVGGQTYTFVPGVEIKDIVAVGAFVKLHFVANADGTLSVREVALADPALVPGSNSNDDNSNLNDNSSNDDNSNDDNSNDDSSNDNANDDAGNDDDSNDDNSNDDSSNDNDNDDDNSNDDGDDDNSNDDSSNDNG